MPDGPIIGGELWRQVMRRCASRCQCTGRCGRTHKKDGVRCPHEDREGAPLAAVPLAYVTGDPLGDIAAMRLQAADLTALCDDCHSGVLTRLRRYARIAAAAAARQAPGLFGLDEAEGRVSHG